MSNLLSQASLVMIPSGYKEDVVYSQIPTSGAGDLSFTRASNGTRINSAGLVEDCPWNLVQYSEDFTNAVWVKSRTTITSNATNAPNGTLTADKFIATSASGVHTISQSEFASGAYSFSVYAKAGEETVISLWLRSAAVGATFDLSAGTVSGITVTSATITDIGGGWYRCFVYDSTPGTTANIYGRTGSSYIGNGVDGFFIWGAQLNIGSTAKPYFPTTDRLNVPRLTYQNGGGGCPSLLLEPQRTNTMLYSQAINSWATKTELTITDNYATSPDGTQSASYIQQTTGGNAVNLSSQNISVTTGQVQTITFYAKAKEVTSISFRLGGTTAWAGGTRPIFNCNLSTGGITIQTGSITVSSESVGNGWYRFIVVTAATIASTTVALQTPTGTIYSSTSGDGFYLWGVQWEQNASYPTTYIPTTSSSATRVADSFSRNNIYTNGLITASGGTWFVELRNNIGYTRDAFGAGLYISDTTNISSNNINIRNGGTSRLAINKVIAGVSTALYLTITDTTKLAIKWNGTTADIFANGTKVISATAFTPTAMQFLSCDATDVPKFIQQMALFPSPLSDTDCTTLTTL